MDSEDQGLLPDREKPIILLVGTQIDLRQDRATLDKLADKNQTPISSEVGAKVAKQLGAAKYVESSSMTKEGLQGVESIIDQAFYESLKLFRAVVVACKCAAGEGMVEKPFCQFYERVRILYFYLL